EDSLRGGFHFADRPAEPAPGEKVRPAGVGNVWREFLPTIVAEDLVPWAVPHTLCKGVIVRSRGCFDLLRQSRSQPAVTDIPEAVFLQVCRECHFTSPA